VDDWTLACSYLFFLILGGSLIFFVSVFLSSSFWLDALMMPNAVMFLFFGISF
jgi:hypothetical protein